MFHTIEVDRVAKDGFGRAGAIVGEVVDALLVGNKLSVLIGRHRNGRTVKEAGADRNVPCFRYYAAGFGKNFVIVNVVKLQAPPAAGDSAAHLSLAVGVKVFGESARVVAPFYVGIR